MPWNFRNINVDNIIFNFMSVIVLNGHFNCNSSHLECMVLIYGCVGLIVIFVSFILFLKNVFLVFLLLFQIEMGDFFIGGLSTGDFIVLQC